MQSKLLLATLGYLVFVIYGSLVPLNLRLIPLHEAIDQFTQIPFLQLGIRSRADWVANGLLFIPLTFMLMGSMWKKGKSSYNTILSVFVVLFACCLSLAIEFTQLFFPRRTVSQNDIAAEAIGGFIGVVFWWAFNKKFQELAERWVSNNPINKWQLYLNIYLFCMFAYSVMPLDLTLSPVELYHKWNNGQLVVVPFSFLANDPLLTLYFLITDVLIWVPVTFLWLNSKSLTVSQVFFRVLICASIIEFCQLFVYSRYTDINDILAAGIGAYISILISKRLPHFSDRVTNDLLKPNKTVMFGVLFFCCWLAVLCVIYWYPFNFDFSKKRFNADISAFLSVPFKSYYIGSEFRAITELFRKFMFGLPLGLAFALILFQSRVLSSKLKLYFVGIISFSFIVLLEFVQMFVPYKTANLTDVTISCLGAICGFQMASKVMLQLLGSHTGKEGNDNKPVEPENIEKDNTRKIRGVHTLTTLNKGNAKFLAVGILFVFLLLIYVIQMPNVPYNIKEIFSDNFYLTAWGFTLLLFITFGFPMAYINWQWNKRSVRISTISKGLLIHVCLTWLLVRGFLPKESIFDIIGTPTWGSLPELEMFIRFSGLFGLISCANFCASLTSFSKINRSDFYLKTAVKLSWTAFIFIMIPFSFIIVIVLSGTDNLTELLPNHGYSLSCLFLVMYLILFTTLGVYCATFIHRKSLGPVLITLLAIILLTPVAFWLVQEGTEQLVIKYGKIFSALQFLLSANRDNYLEHSQLFSRFAVAHLGLVFMFVLTQWHLWLPTVHAGVKESDIDKLKI